MDTVYTGFSFEDPLFRLATFVVAYNNRGCLSDDLEGDFSKKYAVQGAGMTGAILAMFAACPDMVAAARAEAAWMLAQGDLCTTLILDYLVSEVQTYEGPNKAAARWLVTMFDAAWEVQGWN
jgi:hypothetical protein